MKDYRTVAILAVILVALIGTHIMSPKNDVVLTEAVTVETRDGTAVQLEVGDILTTHFDTSRGLPGGRYPLITTHYKAWLPDGTWVHAPHRIRKMWRLGSM